MESVSQSISQSVSQLVCFSELSLFTCWFTCFCYGIRSAYLCL